MRPLTVIFLLLASLPARADTSAQEHLDSGLRHFAAKEYDQAVADFKAGYALEPRPDFLYAWAQAERLRGNCPAAIRLYEQYLASGVTAEQAKVAADNLAKCHKLVGELPPPEPETQPAPPPPAPPPPSPPPAPPPAPSPWYADTFGDVLVVGGVVAAAAGAVLIVTSSSAAADAPSAASYAAYADRIDGARTQRTVALVAVGAGAALVTAGVVHYLVRSAPVEASAWLDGSGAGLGVAGRF